jgi:hypothetical protein
VEWRQQGEAAGRRARRATPVADGAEQTAQGLEAIGGRPAASDQIPEALRDVRL